MCFQTKPYCCYTRKHAWNRSKLPCTTINVLSIFRAWLVIFVSNLKMKNYLHFQVWNKNNQLSKWLISSSKLLNHFPNHLIKSKYCLNHLNILTKLPRMCTQRHFFNMLNFQNTNWRIDLICSFKLFKAISRNYFDVLDTHNTTIPWSNNYDLSNKALKASFPFVEIVLFGFLA